MSSAEKHEENFLKLCLLIVDGGSSGLRKKFDSIHPPSNLFNVLNNRVNPGVLYNLWNPPRGRKPVINNTQWYTLYPKHGSPPTSQDFDVTLLFILLRNICRLPPPKTGWDALPAAGDTSTEAHLARIKYYRNNLYAHATHASIDDTQFETYWKEISDALVALGVSASYIRGLKTLPGKTAYIGLLKEWRESDVDILQDMNKGFQVVGQHVQSVDEKVGVVGQHVQSIDEKVQDAEQKVTKGFQEVGKEFQVVGQHVQSVDEKVGVVGQHVQNLQKGIQEIKKERDKAAAEHEELVKQEKAIKKWVDFLIEEYSTGGTTDITPLPWIESDPMFTLKKLFKEPTISENVKINDLFKSKTKKRMKRVLLEGNPGVGKTTLCKKLVNSWALSVQRCEQTDDSSSGEEGPCFSSTEHSSNSTSPFPAEVEIVLLLKCREIVDTEDWKDILRQEIPENYAGEDKERIIEYICNNEKRVALVIDGYDELNTSEKALHKILCKKALPQSFILMTSRRNRMQAEVKNCFDASLEIKGIESSSGEQLILDFFRSSVGGVPNQPLPLILKTYTRELLCNPLHAAMLCVIIEDNKEILTSAPSLNITTLYKEFIFCLTKRFVKREGLSVDDKEIEGGHYYDLILKIGKYAFDALLEDKLTFTAKDLPQDLLEIGFVEKNKASKKTRCQEFVSYSFLHKSLQDYLAALHFACCLSQGDEDVFWYVDFDELRTFLHYDIVSMIGPDRSCVAVKCLGRVLMEWNGWKDLQNQNRRNVLDRVPSSSVYSIVIGWICEFLDECNRQDQDILSEVALYLPKYVIFNPFYNQKRAVSGLCHWLSYQPGAVHHGTCSLPVSDVSVAEAKNTGIVELSLFPFCSDLRSQSEIIQTILKQNTSLRCLRLHSSDILPDALLALADLIVHNNAIEILQLDFPLNIRVVNALKHNKSLRSLNLSFQRCKDDCVTAIAGMISRSTLLKELTISQMEPQHVDVIANALKDNVSIKTLTLLRSLQCPNILVEMLSGNNVLEKIVFGYMSADQAAHLLKTIKHKTNLRVRVSLNILITPGKNSVALAEQIQQSKVIDELRIGYIKAIGPIDERAIASALALNKSIKSLELYGDVPSSTVADLSQNTVIEKLKFLHKNT